MKGPCPLCGSSDANHNYGDHYYCFSCGKPNSGLDKSESIRYTVKHKKETTPLIVTEKGPNASHRGLTKDTLDYYGCFVHDNKTFLPYGDKCYSSRDMRPDTPKDKRYWFYGDPKESKLFGQDKFAPGSAEYITVYEGAYDAMSGFQAMGSKYPHVAVRSAAKAENEIAASFDYLNSFSRVVLCFDTDEPGRKAATKVASMFRPGRVLVVDLGESVKDANELIQKEGGTKQFNTLWWNAKKYKNDKIVGDWDEIKGILDDKTSGFIATYPFPTLQSMSFGIKESSIVLLMAQEKVGKTEVMGALEYHLLKTTDYNLGILHIEETPKEVIERLATYQAKVPVHLPTSEFNAEDKLKLYKEATGRDNRVHIYSHYGSDDPDNILDAIRYLVTACDCKFVFFDHITMVVTGQGEDRDERKTLDYLSTKLGQLVRELNFTLFLVSHVNDDGKARGSRNIPKIANVILYLERDTENPDPEVRNTTKVMMRGLRGVANSGPAGDLWFDKESYTISEKGAPVMAYGEGGKAPVLGMEGVHPTTPREMDEDSSLPSLSSLQGTVPATGSKSKLGTKAGGSIPTVSNDESA